MVESTESLTFTERAAQVILSIPEGRVATYGQVAAMAGNPRGARQVVRLLHTASDSLGLPWHRVVNREGLIGLPAGGGYEEQRSRLESEGVPFRIDDRIDMRSYQWSPSHAPPGATA
jgi:methylated-DNA-protein-cysteine methyltransferase-like protein